MMEYFSQAALAADYGGPLLAAFLSVALHGLLLYTLISGRAYRYAAPVREYLPFLTAITVVIVSRQWRLPFWYRGAFALLVTVLLLTIYKRILLPRGNEVET